MSQVHITVAAPRRRVCPPAVMAQCVSRRQMMIKHVVFQYHPKTYTSSVHDNNYINARAYMCFVYKIIIVVRRPDLSNYSGPSPAAAAAAAAAFAFLFLFLFRPPHCANRKWGHMQQSEQGSPNTWRGQPKMAIL